MKYIILFDDRCGIAVPMTWDKDCPGAVCCIGDADPVVLFPDRPTAQKAIKISALWATLQKARSIPCCEEFLGKREFVRIVPVVEAASVVVEPVPAVGTDPR